MNLNIIKKLREEQAWFIAERSTKDNRLYFPQSLIGWLTDGQTDKVNLQVALLHKICRLSARLRCVT